MTYAAMMRLPPPGRGQPTSPRTRASLATRVKEFRRDPEGTRRRHLMRWFSGRAPQVGTSDLDAAKQKTDKTHAALEGLNVSVSPNVNLAQLDALIP